MSCRIVRKLTPSSVVLSEVLLRYTSNRQPGKALPYFIRLRRPNVFDLIRENNLFTAVKDQALLLVEFDRELMEKRRKDGEDVGSEQGAAITLLVDHIHSIPVRTPLVNESNLFMMCVLVRSDVWYNSLKGDLTTYTYTWTLCSPKTRT